MILNGFQAILPNGDRAIAARFPRIRTTQKRGERFMVACDQVPASLDPSEAHPEHTSCWKHVPGFFRTLPLINVLYYNNLSPVRNDYSTRKVHQSTPSPSYKELHNPVLS
jgi:hypothetical protein